jgi:hypothetical protein
VSASRQPYLVTQCWCAEPVVAHDFERGNPEALAFRRIDECGSRPVACRQLPIGPGLETHRVSAVFGERAYTHALVGDPER